jgi:hypothetical protein
MGGQQAGSGLGNLPSRVFYRTSPREKGGHTTKETRQNNLFIRLFKTPMRRGQKVLNRTTYCVCLPKEV